MLAVKLVKPIIPLVPIVFGVIYIIIYWLNIPNFLGWNLTLCTGIILAPFIANVNPSQFSLRYLTPTLIALTVAFFIPVKTLFFIALVFALLLLIENTLGKTHEALVFLILLSTPVFKYLVSPVDFPIRLWLTENTVRLLQILGVKATAVGNIIEMDQFTFAVDPACAGLNMLAISLMMGLFTFVYFRKQHVKKLKTIYLLGVLLLTTGLNILSNFFRILFIVLFKFMPGTFLHDFVGIICLIVYVIFPLLFVVKMCHQHFAKPEAISISHTPTNQIRFPYLHAMVLFALFCIAPRLVNADTFSSSGRRIEMNGFRKKILPSGILKFDNNEALIYIKPALFFVPGHDPKLCWTGSGYLFQQIKKEKIGNVEVYTALLTKGKDRIYAAWWFDDGKTSTVGQVFWRWKSATKAAQFYLVNVNTVNRTLLTKHVHQLLINSNYLLERK